MVDSKKCGFVSIVGNTNVGKSTLINCIVGSKVSIVSPKIQTTRRRILGISNNNECQLVLIDTPGLFSAKHPLEKAMIKSAKRAMKDGDVIVVVIDALKYDFQNTEALIGKIHEDLPVVLVINKVDQIDKPKLLDIALKFQGIEKIRHIFMISALKKQGVDDLINCLCTYLPEQPWLFDSDQISNLPSRLWSAEITREQLYHQLQHELPYETYVDTEMWEDFENGSVKIQQVVYVARDSQKAIILGKKGQRIKSISEKSRKEIQYHLGQTVHLFLHVKVAENWMEKLAELRSIGHLDDDSL